MMFLKSKCNNFVVNLDHVLYLTIQRDGNDAEFALVAVMRDDEEVWLDCADDKAEIEKSMRSVIGQIEDKILHVWVTDGQIDTYPHE